MHFHFDAHQSYQLRAIEAVADLFRGQLRVALDFATFQAGEIFGLVSNDSDSEPLAESFYNHHPSILLENGRQ